MEHGPRRFTRKEGTAIEWGKKSYYEILGVADNASKEEIQSVFRRMALENHPDRNGTKKDEERFKRATSAYEVLSDPEKRRLYDRVVENHRMMGIVDLQLAAQEVDRILRDRMRRQDAKREAEERQRAEEVKKRQAEQAMLVEEQEQKERVKAVMAKKEPLKQRLKEIEGETEKLVASYQVVKARIQEMMNRGNNVKECRGALVENERIYKRRLKLLRDQEDEVYQQLSELE